MRLGRTLGELGQTMTSAEFSLWAVLDRREPIGDIRMDIGFGQVCAAIANYAGKVRNKDAAPAVPADYMPFLEKPAEVEPDPMEHFRKF